jgi:hypothetical protein
MLAKQCDGRTPGRESNLRSQVSATCWYFVAIIFLSNCLTDRNAITLRTNELIGFATADVLEMVLSEYLTNRILNVDSNVYVVRYDTGSIISVSPNADYDIFEKLPQYEEIKKEMDLQLVSYMNKLGSISSDNNQNIDQPVYLTPLASGDIITASTQRSRPMSFATRHGKNHEHDRH